MSVSEPARHAPTLNPARYQAFVLTAELESITAAAEVLGVSRPTVSRQLAALEEHLGLALLHRTTRRIWPTPAGARLFERVRPLFRDLARAESDLIEARDEVSGLLRVSVPPVFAPALSTMIMRLLRRHPRLRIEVLADIRKIGLRDDGVEVAVRAGKVGDPDLIQRRLGTGEVYAMASPAYLAEAGTPSEPAELARHQLLRGHDARGLAQQWWPLRSRESPRLAIDGPFVCNDQRVLLAAALDGAGIAMLSSFSAAAELADGRLRCVLPEQLGASLLLHAVYTRRSLQPARVRAFVDALVEGYGAYT